MQLENLTRPSAHWFMASKGRSALGTVVVAYHTGRPRKAMIAHRLKIMDLRVLVSVSVSDGGCFPATAVAMTLVCESEASAWPPVDTIPCREVL